MSTSIGRIACEASIFSIIDFQRSTLISLIGPPSKVSSPLFFNEVVAKFAADEVEEERVESVWDSKEDKLSSEELHKFVANECHIERLKSLLLSTTITHTY